MAVLGRNTRQNFNASQSVTYQRPVSLGPWSNKAGVKGRSNGSLWISMKPRRILDQFSKGQGTIASVPTNTEFKFLAPSNLAENIVHHWEQYESVASRLAQKVRSAVKLGAEGAALMGLWEKKGNLADTVKNTFSKQGGNVGKAVQEAMYTAYGAVGGSQIPRVKIDTPLYYTNSDRRQLVLDFVLFHEGTTKLGMSPEDMLIKPVQELMKYSSPDLQGEIKIEFPFMWDVRTQPFEFIRYTTCALIAVQPTWNGPYIGEDGLPSSCNLQLTFQDMSPLYAGTIEHGSVINVISKERADRLKNTNNVASNPVVREPNAQGANVQRLQ